MNKYTCIIGFSSFLIMLTTFSSESAYAQDADLRYGTGVPAAVRIINDRGLRYLTNTQMNDGSWSGSGNGPGVTGICVMALMASVKTQTLVPMPLIFVKPYVISLLIRMLKPDTSVDAGVDTDPCTNTVLHC